MKKIATTILTIICISLHIQAQLSKKIINSSVSESEVKSHLEEVRLNAKDTSRYLSPIPSEPLSFTQNGSNFPYPIIFVHGLSGGANTWIKFYNHAIEQNWTYGGILSYHLNADGNNYNSNAYDNIPEILDFTGSLPEADFYLMNFRCNLLGQVLNNANNDTYYSSQAGIFKQGLALGEAIKKVIAATGKQKVILFGHSMGGLTIREYLQNPSNWKADPNHHLVAKIITSGTPHGGSNVSFDGISDLFNNIEEESEAVRDLRRTYGNGQNGVFLYGGSEHNAVDGGFEDFWNKDVNCNGLIGDNITGLNIKDIYTGINYCCIIGNWQNNSDGAVGIEYAQLKNYYNIQSETFLINGYPQAVHTNLPEQTGYNVHALDEPDDYLLSYNIETNTIYNGFITQQTFDSPYQIDYDDYIFSTNQNGSIKIEVQNMPVDYDVVILDANTEDVIYSKAYFSSQNASTESIYLPAGYYYFELAGTGTTTSWQYPYNFRLNFTPSVPTSVSDLNTKNIIVYPNPVKDVLSVDLDVFQNKSVSYHLRDNTGKIVLSGHSSNNNKLNISMNHLPSSLYHLTLISDEGIYSKKIFKE